MHARVIVNRFLSVSISFMVASIVPFIFIFLRHFVLVGVTDVIFFPIREFLYSVATIIIIATPSFLILNRFKLANIWTASVTGLIGGAIVYLVPIFIWQRFFPISLLIYFSSIGLITALVFWLAYKFTDNIWPICATGLVGGALVWFVGSIISENYLGISVLIFLSFLGLTIALVFWLAYSALKFADNIWPICATGLVGGALVWFVGNVISESYLGISGLIYLSFLGLITALVFLLAYGIFKFLHNKVIQSD